MVKIFSHYVSKLVSALLLIEILALILSLYGAHDILAAYGQRSKVVDQNFFATASAFSLITAFCMAAFGLYQLEGKPSTAMAVLRLIPAAGVGFGLTVMLVRVVPELNVDLGVLSLAAIGGTSAILIFRALIFRTIALPFLESRVIFVGEGALAKECSTLVVNTLFGKKYNIVGFVPMRNEECAVASSAILPVDESLFSIAKKHAVREIVVSTQNRRGASFPLQQLLECKLNGIQVTGAAAFIEREAHQIRLDSLYPSWLIYSDGFNQSAFRTAVKRAFDLVVSLLIFTLSMPVMLLTMLCIYLEDNGPIIYRQERVGKDGKIFFVLKFRSMRSDAETGDKPQWAATNDSRVTRVGNFIRKVRIDELPQIINVLKGEMSFVGPRPERPYFVQQLSDQIPYYNVRHTIKPGITGFAQVRYQYGSSVEDAIQKLQYDLYYVKNHGLFLDLLILVETLQVVLFAKGSR
jgi:sugar transferase (PEP-CTERM system associated)